MSFSGVSGTSGSFSGSARAEALRGALDPRGLRRLEPHLDLELREHVLGHRLLHRLLRLDLLDPLAGEIGGDADLGAVEVDLVLDHLLELAEVGRDVEVEGLGELRELGLGAGHLEVGLVLLDLLADRGELLARVLDLLDVVAVGLLVQAELLLVLGELLLDLLQIDRELAGGVAVVGLEVGLDLGRELRPLLLVRLHLALHALDEAAVLLEPHAPLLELLDRLVVLVLHLRDRVLAPEVVRELVHLCANRPADLGEDHGSPRGFRAAV